MSDEMTESELGHWHRRALEAESLSRKHAIETTSIHKDMLALAALVDVHYDGVSSPSGFLHGDIMPAIQRLQGRAGHTDALLRDAVDLLYGRTMDDLTTNEQAWFDAVDHFLPTATQ